MSNKTESLHYFCDSLISLSMREKGCKPVVVVSDDLNLVPNVSSRSALRMNYDGCAACA